MTDNIRKQIEYIYSDMKIESPWILVKLQSLLEYILKDINEKNKIRLDLEEITITSLIRFVLIEHLSIENYEIFYKLNKEANQVKHELNMELNKVLIEEYLIEYNKLINLLYQDKKNVYSIEYRFSNVISSNVDSKNIRSPKNIIRRIDYVYDFKTKVTDKKFGIYGLTYQNENINNYSYSKYSIIYGFYIRSNRFIKNDFLIQYEKKHKKKLNMQYFLKSLFTILNMIRNNYPKDDYLQLNFVDIDEFEVDASIALINYHHNIINLLSKNKSNKIKIKLNKDLNNSENIITFNDQEKGMHVVDVDDNIWSKESSIVWNESRIEYNVDELNHRNEIKLLFKEFFEFEDFKQGQFEAICHTLNEFKNSIVILPTGAGKSVIYLFNIMMSPSSSIIISPTELLIEDQIRNFENKFKITNISKIEYYDHNLNLKFNSKIIFINPFVLQREVIIRHIISSNASFSISNVVIDEVHTLSNWSHDFRPEFLMLIKNLITYLDNPKHLGFTATANHRVIEGLRKQLNLKPESVYSPEIIHRDNFKIKFISNPDYSTMIDAIIKLISDLINIIDSKNKLIIFTKNISISKKIIHKINKDKLLNNYKKIVDYSTYSYYDFIENEKYILFATPDMGIGLNLENIRYSIHLGTPLSKQNFVQEIGRVDREKRYGESFVLYENIENLDIQVRKLIDYSMTTDEIIKVIDEDKIFISSDIKDSYKYLFENINQRKKIEIMMLKLLKEIDFNKDNISIKIPVDMHNDYKKILYTFIKIGLINNWYYLFNNNESYYKVQIELSDNYDDLDYLKNETVKYLNSMGEYSQYLLGIKTSREVISLINSVENWFYNEYLFFHREQLLNMIDFLDIYTGKSSNDIMKSLKNYYNIDIMELIKIENEITKLSVKELLEMDSLKVIEYTPIVEQLLVSKYNYKLDILILVYYIDRRGIIHKDRFKRIMEKLSLNQKMDFNKNIRILYSRLSGVGKHLFVEEMLNYYSIDEILQIVFNNNKYDLVYISLIISNINKRMEKLYNAF